MTGQGDGTTPLSIASQMYGDLDMVRCFVKELGADVNQAREDGCAPLNIAAKNGNLKMALCLQLVKEFGAHINLQ